MLKLAGSRGDTIVEVLVSLAVLSLAFAISYATASHALQDSQNSQEHSQALEYLDTQIEALHYEVINQALKPSVYWNTHVQFCFEPQAPSPTPPSQPITIKRDIKCSIPGSGFNYMVWITYGGSSNAFTAHITWPGLGSLGQQSEELSYRIYPR